MIPWLLRNHAGIERTSQCLRRHRPHLGHTPLRSFADHHHIQRDHQRDDDQHISAHIRQIPVAELIGQIFEIGDLGPRRESSRRRRKRVVHTISETRRMERSRDGVSGGSPAGADGMHALVASARQRPSAARGCWRAGGYDLRVSTPAFQESIPR